jgi:hypothetical protein
MENTELNILWERDDWLPIVIFYVNVLFLGWDENFQHFKNTKKLLYLASPGCKGFDDIRTLYPMSRHVLVQGSKNSQKFLDPLLTNSWTELTISFVTWYSVPFFMLHVIFPFHHYLHNMVLMQSKKTNKTPAVNVWTLGFGAGCYQFMDSEM